MARIAPSDGIGSTNPPVQRRIEIGGAGPSDAGTLLELFQRSLPQLGYGTPSRERLGVLLDSADAVALLATRERAVVGTIVAAELPWDSSRLECSLARVHYLAHSGDEDGEAIAQRLITETRSAGEERGWKALWFRVAAADLAGARGVARAGAELMGTLVTFRRTGANAVSTNAVDMNALGRTRGVPVRPATVDDIPRLRRIAAAAYRFDRYHRDRYLQPERVDALWAESIENAVCGRADRVLVADTPEGVQGLITLHLGSALNGESREGMAVIGLVAVAEMAAGRGIGRALVHEAVKASNEAGVSAVEVGTQADNLAAMRLYASCSFEPVAVWLDYRLRLGIAD